MSATLPAVFIDTNGRTAIAVEHTSPFDVHFIRMDQDPLTVLFTSLPGIETMGFKPIEGYPVERAAEKFLGHRAGLNHAARQILERLAGIQNTNRPTTAAGPLIQQQTTNQEKQTMTIEQTLERLAAAQENTAAQLSAIHVALLARNDLLASTGAKLLGESPAPAETAPTSDEKPKRTRRTKEQIAADEAAAAAAPAQAETPATAEEPASEPASDAEGFEDEGFDEGTGATAEVVQRTHEDVQALFGKLSQTGKRDDAIKVIKGKYGFGGVSKIEADKLNAIHDELAELLA